MLRQRFPAVDAVCSSDLLRAVQTADVVAAAYGLQVQQHKNLRERNMGVLQVGLEEDGMPKADGQCLSLQTVPSAAGLQPP